MQALLSHPGVLKLYEYEDGHILELAAAKGDAKMVKLLLDMNMPAGASSMAHASHFNHTEVMEVCGQRESGCWEGGRRGDGEHKRVQQIKNEC